jgi:hypothetical protein
LDCAKLIRGAASTGVPAHTRIAAHSHRDDRVATVISGTWDIGYGDKFGESKPNASATARRGAQQCHNLTASDVFDGTMTKWIPSLSPKLARLSHQA